jgi:predicted NBD/HSP70 family sugar kinase
VTAFDELYARVIVEHSLAVAPGHSVLVEGPARAAALAEARDGAAAGIADLLFLSLGDRIGAALILDGNLYRGATGVVGELGHIVVREGGPRCTCGNLGCVQALATRPAILAHVCEALDAGVVSTLATTATVATVATAGNADGPDELGEAGGHPPLTIEAVVAAASHGDRLASSVLRQAGKDVGRALAAGANLLGPTMVVLGGYAPVLGDPFVDEVRRVLQDYVVPPIWEQMRIGVGVLGARAAALGAAWGALDQLVETGALVHTRSRRRTRGRAPASSPSSLAQHVQASGAPAGAHGA